MNIFVGNLNFRTTEQSVRDLFEAYGEVTSVKIILDRETQRSRGFGFVEMPSDDEARKAIEGTNGRNIDGRTINVNEANPREDRGPRAPRPARDDRW